MSIFACHNTFVTPDDKISKKTQKTQLSEFPCNNFLLGPAARSLYWTHRYLPFYSARPPQQVQFQLCYWVILDAYFNVCWVVLVPRILFFLLWGRNFLASPHSENFSRTAALPSGRWGRIKLSALETESVNYYYFNSNFVPMSICFVAQ